MTIAQLQQELIAHHTRFVDQIQSIPENNVRISRNGKWSAAQQLEHILKSVSPVRLAFFLPGGVLKLLFGTSNRPSKKYDDLVKKYHIKLQEGGRASARFLPAVQSNVPKHASLLMRRVQSLASRLDSYSEEELDLLLLPHPLMGKLTFREMIYFTIYHVQHHHQQVTATNTPV
jgi:hypothetical protein